MRRSTTATILVATLGATIPLALAVTAPGAAVTAPPRPPLDGVAPVDWGECDIPGVEPVPEGYQCAVYPVPLDWSDPDNGETVGIALIRRPAGPTSTGGEPSVPGEVSPPREMSPPLDMSPPAEMSPPVEVSPPGAAGLGSLFIHPGGPGGSGVELVALAGDFLFPPAVLESYDLIGFDSRFTASSEGLQCFTGREDPDDYFADAFLYPDAAADIQRQDGLNANIEQACATNDDRGRDHMSTTDVAHDLSRLHRAVGDPQLNFVGFSYGSLVASYFANLYPDEVGAIVADGVVDPQAYATGYTADNPPLTGSVDDRDGDVPTWHRFNDGSSQLYTTEEFLRLCDEAGPELCAFAPGAAERYEALVAAVTEQPIVIAFPDAVIDEQLLRAITYGALYSSVQMPVLAEDLAYFEDVLADEARPSATRVRAIRDRALADIPAATFGQEQFWGVVCSDGQDPDTIDAWADAAADSFEGFGPLWGWADRACEDWTGRDHNRYEGPWTATTSNPVLVASTTYDPATPYENAVALSRRLPNSTLLTVEGWNHTSLGLSLCGDAVFTSYLLTRELPQQDVRCAQDLLPFGVPAVATPVDEVGTPVRQELDDAAEKLVSDVVESEAEAEAIADEQGIPGELISDDVVEQVVDTRLGTDEAARRLRVAAVSEARERALAPDTDGLRRP